MCVTYINKCISIYTTFEVVDLMVHPLASDMGITIDYINQEVVDPMVHPLASIMGTIIYITKDL